MTDGFAGKLAVVTGAAQGIGAAVASALAEAGATVAALDVNRDGSLLPHERTRRYMVDVADSAAVHSVVAQVERDLGAIDMLVNVAGVLRLGRLTELSDVDWQTTLAVNATGVFNLCRAVGRAMAARRNGAIVTVASNAADTPRMNMGAYAASKAAAAMLTRCLGLELAGYGIRCNVVSPGSTDTEMLRTLWAGDDGAAATVAGSPEQYKLGIPLRRLATPEDVADAVLFLLSDRARHITLHDLRVDGGATL